MARQRTTVRDRGYKKLMRQYKQLASGPHVKNGLPADADDTDKQHGEGDITNLQIALIHEFGSPDNNIPERSWMRTAFDENQKKWFATTRKLASKVNEGRMTISQALEILGLMIEADQKKKINSGDFVPLATSTVAQRAKKGDNNPKPLVDTGQLRAAHTFEKKL